jgi:hypothetical protein
MAKDKCPMIRVMKEYLRAAGKEVGDCFVREATSEGEIK